MIFSYFLYVFALLVCATIFIGTIANSTIATILRNGNAAFTSGRRNPAPVAGALVPLHIYRFCSFG